MRLFTAIELSAGVLEHLVRVQSTLRAIPLLQDAVGWPGRDNLHVTLKFLGDVEDPQVPAVTTALGGLAVPAMTFTVDRFLCFPPRGPARVLAASLAGDLRGLSDLFGRIESALAPLGFPREAREYKPHITLGRIRRPNARLTAQTMVKVIDPALLPTPAFPASQFVLFQSVLDPKGAIYTPVARFGPGGTAPAGAV